VKKGDIENGIRVCSDRGVEWIKLLGEREREREET
jgi:hypothetical protein